jgi:hypothetical protein
MARGDEHLRVKQTFVEKADEVFVVSPLGKIFVDYGKDEVNEARPVPIRTRLRMAR